MGGFLPWIVFLPPAWHRFWERREEGGGEERLFLVVWVVTVLVFFSLSRNKLGTYILPVFPPLALLTADLLSSFVAGTETRPWRRRWILYASLAWLVLLFSLIAFSESAFKDHYPQYLPLNLPLTPAILFVLLTLLGWFLNRERWTPWFVLCSAIWLTLWFYDVKAQEVSEVRSNRSLAQFVNGNVPKEYRVVVIRGDSFAFYLPHRVMVVSRPAEVAGLLGQSIPTIALVKEKHIRGIGSGNSRRFFVWKSIPSGNALVANFPPAPAWDLGSAPNR